jgi:molybdopterin molybdotransferase
MVNAMENRQRIVRLTPLEQVLRRIDDSVEPARPRDMRTAGALGSTLAEDVVIADPHPATPLALVDGFAVYAEATSDAGVYAPTFLLDPREVAFGRALPPDSDAVAPFGSVTWREGQGEVHAAMTPGEGVLLPGADAGKGELLRHSGDRLRAIDVAAMQALGVTTVWGRRPRVRIARVGRGRNDIADAISDWLAYVVASEGCEPVVARPGSDIGPLITLGGADGVMLVGGTGMGSSDESVHALARTGTVEAHGIAISPGETAAFGIANSRPVLLVPGRLDAAAAVWLLIGRVMLARLRGGTENGPSGKNTLTVKVTSTVGLTELVLVRRVSGGVEPLASKYLPLASLSHADGWIVIPAESEGLPAGSRVIVRPLP